MSLKQKTIKGFFWSFIDNFAKLGVQFVVGIILARLLAPREFGLVGMLAIFIAVSQSLVDSGFSVALIRKKSCSDADLSTVFYFNLLLSILIYAALFLCAELIANFFDEPQLVPLVKILGLGIILNAFGIIQQTILTREINFKVQTYVTLISSITSGVVAIVMAMSGFGVWSLVALTLVRFGLNSLLLWMWSKWKPLLLFSTKSFKELFGFGAKIMIAGLIDTIYQNIYYVIIGRYFSAQELGFYTRADQFRNLPSRNIMTVIQRVSFPVLASIQDHPQRLRENYQKLIRSTMFVTFVLMFGMAAVSKSMVLALIGEKWLPTVIYLQLLCFVGMFYPLNALNINILNVKGRSDLILRLEFIKKSLAVPVVVIGIFWGIKIMILAMIINSIIGFGLNSYWSGALINYSTINQIRDILPAFIFAFVINSLVYILETILLFDPVVLLIVQVAIGGLLVIGLGEAMKQKDYLYIKQIITEQLKTKL